MSFASLELVAFLTCLPNFNELFVKFFVCEVTYLTCINFYIKECRESAYKLFFLQFISEDERNGQIENTTTSKTHLTVAEEPHKPRIVRLQDKHLQEMSDDGLCLSMHQPWASLLVRGIKK